MADRGPVVLFGGSGLVGSAVRRSASRCDLRAVPRAQADIGDPEAVDRVLDEIRPRAVINCAVFQPVDLCESRAGDAFRVNATAAGIVARSRTAPGPSMFMPLPSSQASIWYWRRHPTTGWFELRRCSGRRRRAAA